MEDLKRATRARVLSFEPVVVAAFLVASLSAFVFLRLTSEIREGETMAFDNAILLSLREPQDLATPIGPAWLTKALVDVTSLGGITVLSLLVLFSVVYLILIRKRITALMILFSVLSGWAISSVIKIGIARPRPDLVPHLVDVHDLSFPSGHAMVSSVAYLTLGLLLAGMQTSRSARYYLVIVAVLLTSVIGCSRVYLGVHYPTDVLGGWSAGAAWACLCWLAARLVIPAAELSRQS